MAFRILGLQFGVHGIHIDIYPSSSLSLTRVTASGQGIYYEFNGSSDPTVYFFRISQQRMEYALCDVAAGPESHRRQEVSGRSREPTKYFGHICWPCSFVSDIMTNDYKGWLLTTAAKPEQPVPVPFPVF